MTFPISPCDKESEGKDSRSSDSHSNNNLITSLTWTLRYLSVIVCVADNCTDYMLQFEKVFSVPGDVAMLNSTLLISSVFNFSAVPYNITWYHSATGKEMTDQIKRVLVQGETLWFLNVTEEDAGKYVTTVRYGSRLWSKVLVFRLLQQQPITLPSHQNTNVVLQTVHWAGGGPAVCWMRKAEKSWPAPHQQSSWCPFLPSQRLYHQAEQLQRHLLHHVVQSEWWERLLTAINNTLVSEGVFFKRPKGFKIRPPDFLSFLSGLWGHWWQGGQVHLQPNQAAYRCGDVCRPRPLHLHSDLHPQRRDRIGVRDHRGLGHRYKNVHH